MLDPTKPFVLIDDARPDGSGRLYADPVRVVTAHANAEVRPALATLREGVRSGLHAAGYLAYEAGLALEERLVPLAAAKPGLLLWFGLFERVEHLGPGRVDALLSEHERPAAIGSAAPAVDEAAHAAMVERVQTLIAAGDVYQVNATFPAELSLRGHPVALYRRLRRAAMMPHGALLRTGGRWLLSCSPELFFALEGERLTARPMKGTAPREHEAGADAAAAQALSGDTKNRAENLMIVDLLRNDLARVADSGSVEVPALFAVETYPTVHQMTSTVTARLASGRDAVDVIAALFPCGSITGAPKLRAMEVIDAIEPTRRGAYCGSIGWIDPGGDAAFNVAIRTLEVPVGDRTARLGLGSGIVADSVAADEWVECLAKGRFTQARSRLCLIETMRFDPVEGIPLARLHMARMKASATRFGIPFDRHAMLNRIQTALARERTPLRVRLLVAPSGVASIQCMPLPPAPVEPVPVRIVPLPVDPSDWRLRHKTTDRAFYDAARRSMPDVFEVLFELPDGRLTEGSFTSLFVPDADGRLRTPDGPLLPGVLAASLLEQGRAHYGRIGRNDLAQGLLIGNAVRGLTRARLID